MLERDKDKAKEMKMWRERERERERGRVNMRLQASTKLCFMLQSVRYFEAMGDEKRVTRRISLITPRLRILGTLIARDERDEHPVS